MAFLPGQILYHDYGEHPACIHTRVVMGHIENLDYMIRTPDGDMYVETCDGSNVDLAAFYVGADDGSIPAGVAPASVYGFPPMNLQQFNAMLAEGRQEVLAELGRRGIALPVAAAPAAPNWVLAEHVAGHKIGEVVQVVPGMVQQGNWGLHVMTDGEGYTRTVLVSQVAPEAVDAFCETRIGLARMSEAISGSDRFAGEDVRTLEVRFGASGERTRSFKDTVQEMVQVDYDDFPLAPRTALSYVRAISTVAESAYAQHLSWVVQSRIPDGDRAVHEDEVLSRALDLAVTYDCLNISNLASYELLIRRKQLLAEAHAYNPSAPSYEGADHFLGTSYRPGGAIIVPELVDHVAKKLHQESQILKEKRKQQEAKGGKKGKGRGSAPNPPDSKGGGGGGK